jgi:hypothetical protein
MAGNMIVRRAFVGLDEVNERTPTQRNASTYSSFQSPTGAGVIYHLIHLPSHSGIDAMPD